MDADLFNVKTVLLLNHTHYLSVNSGDKLAIDGGSKSSHEKVLFQKSIWSNLVEAVLQYCRIVFDIFSTEKPISIITFDDEEKIHSIWLDEDQNLETLWNIFTQEGPPKQSVLNMENCPTLPGLTSVCNMLQMMTPLQKEMKVSENNGRVVVLGTSMGSRVRSWIPDILSCLKKHTDTPDHMTINASEWIFIDLFPESELPAGLAELSPILITIPERENLIQKHRFYYHRIQATGQHLYQGLMRLAESHYKLSSTLVQDIPMKEEANSSSSSAMYGVELLHRNEVHNLLKCGGLIDKLMIRSENGLESSLSRPNSGFSKTLGIKWVTPKTSDSNYLRFAIAAYRATLADVHNRASVCLAQFVLGGRSVALAHRVQMSFPALPETPNYVAVSAIDEALLLTCHGSVMYLHVLATIFPLVHPLSIPLKSDSNSIPSDYRVQAFIDQILRPSRLAPASARSNYAVLPKERALQNLERPTRYWPLLESQTLLGKNKLAAPLFEHLPKEYLEPNEISACEEALLKLVYSIKQHVSLTDTKKSVSKRSTTNLPVSPTLQAEAITMATELDYLLSVYSDISIEHEQIRNYWIQTISSSKMEISTSISFNKSDDKLKCSNLSEMIRIARTIAYDDDDIQSESKQQLIIPPTLIKVMRNLTVLCDRLCVDLTNTNKSLNKLNKRSHPSSSELSPGTSCVIEPTSLATFIGLLQPPKRVRTKPDFVGILSSDSKGLCQLYKSLKEKEKVAN